MHDSILSLDHSYHSLITYSYADEIGLLLFLLHTGSRIQEAFRLVWPDVDFERQYVRLGTRKTFWGGMDTHGSP